MTDNLPEYLQYGEQARLFPVLSTTSKEGRTTSIVLACMAKIDEFGASLLQTVGQRVGVRTTIQTYTEVVLKSGEFAKKQRPDGLIVAKTGSREWRALVETKIGSSELEADQIDRYRQLAKENGIDCVITISNQFATTPEAHPLAGDINKRLKIPVFHWSWMYVLTEADLLLGNDGVQDVDQRILLNELRRFLTHESAGVKGFDRMPKEWTELNRLVSSGGVISVRSPEAQEVVAAWHQETRDLTLILSRMTETAVTEKLQKKHKTNFAERQKAALSQLASDQCLLSELIVTDAAAPLEIQADLRGRTVSVGMTLRAPEDRKSTPARVNWLLRQLKSSNLTDLYVRLYWPGRSEPTQHPVAELLDDVSSACKDREHLAPHSFSIFVSKRLGGRFTQQTNFIVDLEELVPSFYGDVGSKLTAWKKSAPKIKEERSSSEDVSPEALAEDASVFE